jgi:DNA-binding MarR family transcriptional regulator
MSTPSRAELVGMVTDEVREQQIAYDRFHDAVAAYLGLNRTDLRCLDILDLAGRQTAGKLAVRMGMSTGAVTAMLDRLEKAGYVRRLRDPGDRRRVLVEPTELAGERGQEIYAPFGEQVAPMFARFTDVQLALVRDFLRLGNDFYVVQTSRIEQLARSGPQARGGAREPGGVVSPGKIREDSGSREDPVHSSPPNPPASPDPPGKTG